ncbi:MAG: gamma-glutamyltransferase [Acidobacteria bacterium]|nr:gamma-glutamyltransferase [Acidobacteriota bacterium]
MSKLSTVIRSWLGNGTTLWRWSVGLLIVVLLLPTTVGAQNTQDRQFFTSGRTVKPVLHGTHWVAITGKPLGATAGSMIFQRGGNAVDAACAMLGATSTMWDSLGWGGETQALIYDPNEKKVIGINGLGVAPTGATAEFFKRLDLEYPPSTGPLAAVTPGTPGALMVMLAEWGTMSLAEVLEPSIEMADGYAIEASAANNLERNKELFKEWGRYSTDVFLPHLGEEREAPYPGEIFRQPNLAATLRKLVEAEAQALDAGKSREEAIYAAYERFYRGDIAAEFARGAQEVGGLITADDLANWEVKIEEPVMTTYKGIEVYKLTHWQQGPVMLQALNILENFDLQAMGYNSSRYVHTLYQTMNLAFADRDFYYGDPDFPPAEPIEGLLSKEYARQRAATINWEENDPDVKPGDPYPFQGGTNPYLSLLERWSSSGGEPAGSIAATGISDIFPLRNAGQAPPIRIDGTNDWGTTAPFGDDFFRGTTSVQAADEEGWIVSITPSGGWIPAVIAGETGVGLSQRLQSFVVNEAENPYNVVEPGKRPRVTLTPGMAIRDGEPYLSFAVQGGDGQDQNLLQFFLNVVEWDMNVQQAAEAANINSSQMKSSFGQHPSQPGSLLVRDDMPPEVVAELRRMGYNIRSSPRTSGPINAIFFDILNGTMWGGSSNHGEDYGIAWE